MEIQPLKSVCLKVETLSSNYFRKIAEELSFQKIPVEFWGKYGWFFSFLQLSFENSVQKTEIEIPYLEDEMLSSGGKCHHKKQMSSGPHDEVFGSSNISITKFRMQIML